MLTRDEVQSDYDHCTKQISAQSRTISLAILAIVWLFLAAQEKPAFNFLPDSRMLFAIGALCLVSLLADYFHYLAGYFNSKKLLDDADNQAAIDLLYDYTSCSYRARTLMFVLKQISALLAALLLIVMGAIGVAA